jgi:hypothetical protein
MVLPLPTVHMPAGGGGEELKTCSVHGVDVSVPVHRALLQRAVSDEPMLFGAVLVGTAAAAQNGDDKNTAAASASASVAGGAPQIGAIGCAARVLLLGSGKRSGDLDGPHLVSDDGDDVTSRIAPQTARDDSNKRRGGEDGDGDDETVLLLYRGEYRFVIRQIRQSIPYPVAVVEELLDDDEDDDDDSSDRGTGIRNADSDADQERKRTGAKDADMSDRFVDDDDDEEEEDNDDDPMYQDAPASDLHRRTLLAMRSYVDGRLQEAVAATRAAPTLLEESILEAAQHLQLQQQRARQVARHDAEERAAVLDVFQVALVDSSFATAQERYRATAFLAAELCDLDNVARHALLLDISAVRRLRLACQCAEQAAAHRRARTLAASITDRTSEAAKDLRVGAPSLPPWARQLRRGVQVEYFWNEEHGWCRGTVVDDPVPVASELIVTVHFDDDGTTHRLPLSPDDKARWRPAAPM